MMRIASYGRAPIMPFAAVIVFSQARLSPPRSSAVARTIRVRAAAMWSAVETA
ncbi:hypothetical protein JOE48_001766 [Methylobacterium sp. PvR107]|nr:hypothetical protein [Methylobacterium sp. PvR107]